MKTNVSILMKFELMVNKPVPYLDSQSKEMSQDNKPVNLRSLEVFLFIVTGNGITVGFQLLLI